MGEEDTAWKKHLARAALFAVLALLLLPGAAFWFSSHGLREMDHDFTHEVLRSVPQEELARARAFFVGNPPSSVCWNPDPELAGYRADVCATGSTLWQFALVQRVSFWLLVAGAGLLLVMVALGCVAFARRSLQYASFMLGRRLMQAGTVLEIIAQGVLLVWMTFWVPVFFTSRYMPKIIAIIGFLVAMAAFSAIAGIVRRPSQDNRLDGELLGREDAPDLWQRISTLAQTLHTQPPDHIVAGVDANFFVTEFPARLGERELRGRILYVSIPLLRILTTDEADAVLAHELAHLHGGDTANSAALGPALMQYGHYLEGLGGNVVSFAASWPMVLYRWIFEFALQRESRRREFMADSTAAKLVGAKYIVHSLIKIAAYSGYRAKTEEALFSRNHPAHGDLGIGSRVASGLHGYVHSKEFQQDMQRGNVPHPFDSHPPLQERMENVQHREHQQDFGEIAATLPQQSWVAYIPTADEVEQRLWAQYEAMFSEQHEIMLAHHLNPQDQEQEEVVLRHFPPVTFELKKGRSITLTWQGLMLPGETALREWAQISDIQYQDGWGADVMTLILKEKRFFWHKKKRCKLHGIKPRRDEFKQTLGRYWQRHLIALVQKDAESPHADAGDSAGS